MEMTILLQPKIKTQATKLSECLNVSSNVKQGGLVIRDTVLQLHSPSLLKMDLSFGINKYPTIMRLSNIQWCWYAVWTNLQSLPNHIDRKVEIWEWVCLMDNSPIIQLSKTTNISMKTHRCTHVELCCEQISCFFKLFPPLFSVTICHICIPLCASTLLQAPSNLFFCFLPPAGLLSNNFYPHNPIMKTCSEAVNLCQALSGQDSACAVCVSLLCCCVGM